MNYHHLKQIVNHLQEFDKIKTIRRIAENKISLELASRSKNLTIIIDLQGAKSAIYSGHVYAAGFKSAFDLQLAQFAGAKITASWVSEHNRIWRLSYERAGAYATVRGGVAVEFLGRKNNFVLLDARGHIASALRYVSERNLRQNAPYCEPASEALPDKFSEITNISEFLASEFATRKASALEQSRHAICAQLGKKKRALLAKLQALASEAELSKRAAAEYARGELLKANLYRLAAYERQFELDGERFELECAPSVALKEIFKRAKKLAAKAAGVGKERENLSAKIRQIEQSELAVRSCEDENLLRLSYAKREKSAAKNANSNILEFYINDYKISVGLNENANSELLSRAKKSDWWFHLQGEPGAHAILQTAKKQPDIDIIYQTALLAAAHSGKKNGAFMVDFTQRSKLHRSAGAHVAYNEYDSIKVFLSK